MTSKDLAPYKALEAAIFPPKSALDFLPEGVAISDPSLDDNPIVYVNEAFLRLTGYTREEILMRNCRFMQGPDTDQVELAKLRSAIKNGEPITIELLNYRKDGSSFWNHLTVSPIKNMNGDIVSFVAIQRDVSAIHMMREQLATQEADLGKMNEAVELLKNRVTEQEDVISSFIMQQLPAAS